MLYYGFKNYEQFKELFGIQKHENGTKSRRNKILLAYLKNKILLHNCVESCNFKPLLISNMADLKQYCMKKIAVNSFA